MDNINKSTVEETKVLEMLENSIKLTNQTLSKWFNEWHKSKQLKFITYEEIQGMFIGHLKKMMRHHFNDDMNINRFFSNYKMTVTVNGLNHQISSLSITDYKFDWYNVARYYDVIKKVLSYISYPSLYYKESTVEITNTNTSDISLISFESIENIKF